jgi:L-rhamnose-H+ transport protein
MDKMGILAGLLLVTFSGLGTGTAAWPFKRIKDIHFGEFLFVSMLTGLIIYPWAVVLFNVPDPAMVIKSVGFKTLLASNLLSVSWGIANILYMVCVIRIGASLAGAILSALGMSVGVLIPMIFKGSGLFSNAPGLFSNTGGAILVGLATLITGLIFISKAGFGREKVLSSGEKQEKGEQSSKSFSGGLILAVLAGILSGGISLAFVYSQEPIIAAVKQQGAGEITANFTVWALGMFGGALANVSYGAYLMIKSNRRGQFPIRKGEFLCGALVGSQFIISIVLLGKGMVMLGVLGASVGFGIQQSLQVIGNQLVGFIGGEWRGISGKPVRLMYVGLIILLVAVCIFAFSNAIYSIT